MIINWKTFEAKLLSRVELNSSSSFASRQTIVFCFRHTGEAAIMLENTSNHFILMLSPHASTKSFSHFFVCTTLILMCSQCERSKKKMFFQHTKHNEAFVVEFSCFFPLSGCCWMAESLQSNSGSSELLCWEVFSAIAVYFHPLMHSTRGLIPPPLLLVMFAFSSLHPPFAGSGLMNSLSIASVSSSWRLEKARRKDENSIS